MQFAVIEPSAWRAGLDEGPETDVAGLYGRTTTVYGPWHGVVWIERYALNEDFDDAVRWARKELEDELARQVRRRAEEA